MIRNLIMKGGGVLGIAYAGAIRELEDKGALNNLERVAGTSAGAIVATLLSLRYNSAEIFQILSETNFASFQDGKNPLGIFTKYGMYRGDAFLKWMEEKINRKRLSKNATFADLKNAGCLDLNIFAADLNERYLQPFNLNETPGAIVAEAVRASMSIPLFFKAWRFSNGIPDKNIYVDGGIIYNYPITFFDNKELNKNTVGLFLKDVNENKTNNGLEFNQVGQYVKALVETILESQNINMAADVDEMSRTIIIDDLGISPTDFDITKENQMSLYQSGINSVKPYFFNSKIIAS